MSERGTSVALEGRTERCPDFITEDLLMLWTLALVLFILWLLGAFAFHVAGGLIHLLLVIALIVVVYRLVTGRRSPV